MRIAVERLRGFCADLLVRGGLSESDAAIVSDVLLFAELRGIPSHGVVRLPFYLERLEVGGTDPRARPEVVTEGPGTALVEANNGMGHVACVSAVDVAARKAAAVGVSFVGVRGSSHNGALSYYAVQLAARELIGIVVTNTTPLMTAWGGATAAIGNNPLAVAAPFRPGHPFVFDAAMSSVAAGRIREAADRGEKIPRGWIVDEHGRDTDDPADFRRGALLPFGQHKGYGLALMVEILSAVITGAGMLGQNPFWQEAVAEPLNIGHAFIAVDIARFMEPSAFRARLEFVATTLMASPPAEGSSGVIMPGDLEHEAMRRRQAEGIPLAEGTWRRLVNAASAYDVPVPAGEAD